MDKRVPEQDKDYGRLLALIGPDRIVYWVPSPEYTGKHADFKVDKKGKVKNVTHGVR